MFDRYIQIRDRQIVVGQNSSGIWYCKELCVDNTKELDKEIGEINGVLNKYNLEREKTKSEETVGSGVKGLK